MTSQYFLMSTRPSLSPNLCIVDISFCKNMFSYEIRRPVVDTLNILSPVATVEPAEEQGNIELPVEVAENNIEIPVMVAETNIELPVMIAENNIELQLLHIVLEPIVAQYNIDLPIVAQNNNDLRIVVELMVAQNNIDLPIVVEPIEAEVADNLPIGRK